MQRWLKSVRPFGSFQLLSLPSFQRKGLYFVNYSKAVLTLISHHLITQFPRSKRKDTTWPHLLFPRTNKLTRRIYNKHLMTGPEGNSEFCFPRISMFPETKSRETLKFENRAEIPAITCNSGQQWTVDRVTRNCFPFDVIAFAMLPAHGIWRETVSLLDVMWPWTSQWKDAL